MSSPSMSRPSSRLSVQHQQQHPEDRVWLPWQLVKSGSQDETSCHAEWVTLVINHSRRDPTAIDCWLTSSPSKWPMISLTSFHSGLLWKFISLLCSGVPPYPSRPHLNEVPVLLPQHDPTFSSFFILVSREKSNLWFLHLPHNKFFLPLLFSAFQVDIVS